MKGKNTRWCFFCETPRRANNSGYLWFHKACAEMLTTKAMDLEALVEKIKAGKIKTIEEVLAFVNDMDALYAKMGFFKAEEWIKVVRGTDLSRILEVAVQNAAKQQKKG
jgi:hypothetical protein